MTVYLIDGYNLLHQLLGHHRGESGRAERRPGKRLPGRPPLRSPGRRACPTSRTSATVWSTASPATWAAPPTGPSWCSIRTVQMLQKTESATANVEVYFGSFSRSADSIIEREVYALSAGENVVVVSSDYQLQKTIFLPNVIRRSSRQFVADLQEHTKRIANSQNCITMSHRIEDRIDPDTVDRLKALRDELAAAAGGAQVDRSSGSGS